MSKVKQRKWSKDDRRAFAETRLRAQTIPNKRRKASAEACRKNKGR
jgi:hypothetical protein